METEKIIALVKRAIDGVDLSDMDKAVAIVIDRLWHEELEELEKALSELRELHRRVDEELTKRWYNS